MDVRSRHHVAIALVISVIASVALTAEGGARPSPAGNVQDDNVEWDGLRHDSRDLLHRTPAGAVAAGTQVRIRFRTFHDDVTAVQLRVYDVNLASQRILTMALAAPDQDCYQAELADRRCDFWETILDNAEPNNLWYRFIVTDGTDTDYYADDTPAVDGGLGAPSDDVVDQSWALTVHVRGFKAPGWVRKAVIYQIFPDRFRNGNIANDPRDGDTRYDDPVLALPWGTLPEGYCHNYADAAENCPWRFDDDPPPSSPDVEEKRGRDYMGGDLAGVDRKLADIERKGATAIYFNPVFDSASNHGYDTQDYYSIDPYFGTQRDWNHLVRNGGKRGIRLIVDGVFNHMSSDGPFFDRYDHFPVVGACESPDSPYRDWFHFRPPVGEEPSPCAPSVPGGDDTYYDGWAGFDSIPVIDKTNPEVQAYFLTAPDSVSRHWLRRGAAGWRLDVMGDPSFPDGYWETFRRVVKGTNPTAVIIAEIWQKDTTLLRSIRGDRADAPMNYRFRDATVGLLAPGPFDAKGFADSGYPLEPSQFAARMLSIREDYADAAYFSAMNLLDSHDTERVLWTLTPGGETTQEKELDQQNLAEGKRRVRLASLVQFSVPGAPTVYYGDEVGVTGDDDPDDRRTYPWTDLGFSKDGALLDHYQVLAELRKAHTALIDGDFRVFLTDDRNDVVAFGRRTDAEAALVAVNKGGQSRTVDVPVAGTMPDGTVLHVAYQVGNTGGGTVTVSGGKVSLTLARLSGMLLLSDPEADLTPPPAPRGLQVTEEGDGEVRLRWDPVPGAAGYNLYRSPLTGGGYVKVAGDPLTETSYTDTELRNAQEYFYVVRALDGVGNESAPSNEASGLPHLEIGWANLQGPSSMEHTISTSDRTDPAYGQVWIDGVTNLPGPADTLRAQLGFGPDGSDPSTGPGWAWAEAAFNADVGNNDEFVGSLLPEQTGVFDYAYRYTTTDGRDWLYADLDGTDNGYSPSQSGSLTVEPSDDITPPATPTGLTVVTASPAGVDLAWDPVEGDPTLYGYEVLRGEKPGGPYAEIARVTETSYTDLDVVEGATYYYVVRSLDTSFNRSPNSGEVEATAKLRTVTLVFDVTVPDSTEGTGRSVYIAGTLSRLDGDLPDWDPGGVVLTQVDATHWTITLTGKETTQIEYKYTLGDWEHVEKDASCQEIGNRLLTLDYGTTGIQAVDDLVENWRNVPPCGN